MHSLSIKMSHLIPSLKNNRKNFVAKLCFRLPESLDSVYVNFILSILNITQIQNVTIKRNLYFIRRHPLEAAVKQGVFAGERACLFEWRRSRHEFKPAAQTACLTGSLAQPNLRRGVVFLYLLSLTKQRK
ncbi:MAG: hypothetical protein Q4G42_01375 [Neisseria sp.]|nr:hypothetical protein [Neisseria sp.]